MFSVGDKVMHPKFGAGRITGESHRELVAGYENYFVIEVVGTGATAYVPIQKMGELGVRCVISTQELADVFSVLRSIPDRLENDYKKRQARVEEMLKTHEPISLAEVIRDLTWHRTRKHLTQKDETLLNRGRELLASEIALATDAPIASVQEAIDSALASSSPSPTDARSDVAHNKNAPEVSPEALVQELLNRVAG
jgi:CarD family transcriptional regulator